MNFLVTITKFDDLIPFDTYVVKEIYNVIQFR